MEIYKMEVLLKQEAKSVGAWAPPGVYLCMCTRSDEGQLKFVRCLN